MYLFLSLTFLCLSFGGCSDHNDEDKVQMVEMTIYPETEHRIAFLSDTWMDVLVFSESDDNQERPLYQIITEGFDFDYERGYEYTFEAKKVWMHDPPMDVSSVKYIFVGSFAKNKVITEDSEKEIELFVSSELVKYCPMFPTEYENEQLKVYDALHVKDTNSNNWFVLKEIEGFNYESGYEYTLSVKKMIYAEPYMTRYVLLDTKSKQQK